MGEMMKEASEIKNTEAKMAITSTIGSNKGAMNMSFRNSDNNIAINDISYKIESVESNESDIKLNALVGGFNGISLSDPIRIIDGDLYINLGVIIDTLNDSMGGQISIDKESLGIEWLSVTGVTDKSIDKNMQDAANDLSNTLSDAFVDILNASDTKIEKDGDNGYKVSVNDAEGLKKVVDAAYDNLNDKKDTYVSKIKDLTDSLDFEDVKTKTVDNVKDLVKTLCDNVEIKYTDDDLNSIGDMIASSFESEEFKQMQDIKEDDIKNTYDKALDALKEMKEKIDKADDFKAEYKISLEGKEGSRVCDQSLTLNATIKDEGNVDISVETKSTDEGEAVTAPKDAKTLSDAVPNIIDFLKKSGFINDAALEQIKGQNLSDVLASMQQAATAAETGTYDLEDAA